VAVAGPAAPARVRSLRLSGDRTAVRRGAVSAALALLADQLAGSGRPPGPDG
jgi:nicotinamide mononucleotide (NMN) deamidase PncC